MTSACCCGLVTSTSSADFPSYPWDSQLPKSMWPPVVSCGPVAPDAGSSEVAEDPRRKDAAVIFDEGGAVSHENHIEMHLMNGGIETLPICTGIYWIVLVYSDMHPKLVQRLTLRVDVKCCASKKRRPSFGDQMLSIMAIHGHIWLF